MKIVNGYVCMTSCDERVAKRGVDPRNPREDPVKQAMLDAQSGKTQARDDLATADAVTFGGTLVRSSASDHNRTRSFGLSLDVRV